MTPVALIDDTLFILNEDRTALRSWTPGEGLHPPWGGTVDDGTLEDFAVIRGDLFFLYRSEENYDDGNVLGQVLGLYHIDPDTDTLNAVVNQHAIDVYTDWFA